MSTNVAELPIVSPPSEGAQSGFDVRELLERIVGATRHPLFAPISVAIVALLVLFWPLTRSLYELWTVNQYYSHGFLVPFLAGFIVFKRWPRMAATPVAGSSWAALGAFGLLPFLLVAYRGNQLAILSMLFVAYSLIAIWFVAGRRWAFALSPVILFLLFGLPAVPQSYIDAATNPMQLASTKVAVQILQATGFQPTQFNDQPTVVTLNTFSFNVAVACSGLKLLIAVSAFTALFLLIGKLSKVGNFLMLAVVLPLCLLLNGMRIALVGMIGDRVNADIPVPTVDQYSGYAMLAICFFVLFRFARLLGWRD